MTVIRDSFSPEPHVELLDQVADYKAILQPAFGDLHNRSGPLGFASLWKPKGTGLEILKVINNQVHCAKSLSNDMCCVRVKSCMHLHKRNHKVWHWLTDITSPRPCPISVTLLPWNPLMTRWKAFACALTYPSTTHSFNQNPEQSGIHFWQTSWSP